MLAPQRPMGVGTCLGLSQLPWVTRREAAPLPDSTGSRLLLGEAPPRGAWPWVGVLGGRLRTPLVGGEGSAPRCEARVALGAPASRPQTGAPGCAPAGPGGLPEQVLPCTCQTLPLRAGRALSSRRRETGLCPAPKGTSGEGPPALGWLLSWQLQGDVPAPASRWRWAQVGQPGVRVGEKPQLPPHTLWATGPQGSGDRRSCAQPSGALKLAREE